MRTPTQIAVSSSLSFGSLAFRSIVLTRIGKCALGMSSEPENSESRKLASAAIGAQGPSRRGAPSQDGSGTADRWSRRSEDDLMPEIW